MAKMCPLVNRPVVYLECLECDEKVCRTGKSRMGGDNDEFRKDHEECNRKGVGGADDT